MAKNQIFVLGISLLLTAPAFADDAASGMPSGKRQHKPVSATQPQEPEEAQGTRVRKTMQELKGVSQDAEPAMNKAELTERIASPPPPPPTTRMNKAELIDDMASDADLSKADSKRAAEPAGVSERLRHKDRDVAEQTDKDEAARAKKKPKPPQ